MNGAINLHNTNNNNNNPTELSSLKLISLPPPSCVCVYDGGPLPQGKLSDELACRTLVLFPV